MDPLVRVVVFAERGRDGDAVARVRRVELAVEGVLHAGLAHDEGERLDSLDEELILPRLPQQHRGLLDNIVRVLLLHLVVRSEGSPRDFHAADRHRRVVHRLDLLNVLVLALAVRKAGLLTGAGTIVSASPGSSSSTGSAHQHPGTSRGDALSFVQELHVRASVYGRGAGPKAKGPAL